MTATDNSDLEQLLSRGSICSCPVCTGIGLGDISTQTSNTVTANSLSPLTSIPVLHSLPGANATLYLDFDGYSTSKWGGYSNVVTRVYDQDGDATTFNDLELQSIRDIWSRTAEDYAPFNINVTTVDPGADVDRVSARIAIGGNWSDWFGQSAGGVAYIGGFYNSAPNVGFVFEDALGNGSARYVAEAVSHEAGHLFGLQHQSNWDGNTLVSPYSRGTSDWAPIMGVGYYSTRTTWNLGPTEQGPTTAQDDMTILAGSLNAFGYRVDDYGNTQTTAKTLDTSTGSINASGLIGTNSDVDWFSFTAGTGTVTLDAKGITLGTNLDVALELLNSAGEILVTANPLTSLNASLSIALQAGTYYAVVRSSGGYGNVGTYALTGVVIPSGDTTNSNDSSGGGSVGVNQAAPGEIDLFAGTTAVPTDSTVFFGSTKVGTTIDRTFTIKNAGLGSLQLTPLNAASIPSGFSLLSNLSATTLSPGESANFRVRLLALSAGNYAGRLQILSNDPDEGTYIVNLGGTVIPPIAVVENSSTGFQTTGTWNRIQAGRGKDSHLATSGDGSTTGTWTFRNLIPGQYRVHATWPASTKYATDAPFTVRDGRTPLQTLRINQEKAPSGLTWSKSAWSSLGTFTITGDTLVVQLANNANDRVVADAIRVEWAGPRPTQSIIKQTPVLAHSGTAEVGASLEASVAVIAKQVDFFSRNSSAMDKPDTSYPRFAESSDAPDSWNVQESIHRAIHSLDDLLHQVADDFVGDSQFDTNSSHDRTNIETDADKEDNYDRMFNELTDWLSAYFDNDPIG